MRNFINRVFDTSAYNREGDRYRALLVYGATAFLFAFYMLYAALVPEWSIEVGVPEDKTMLQSALSDPAQPQSIAFYIFIIFSAAGYYLTRRGNVTIARWMPPLTWYMIGVLLAVLTVSSPAFVAANAILLIVLAGLLVGQWGIAAALVASLLALTLRVVTDSSFARVSGEPDIINVSLQIIGGAALIYLFLRLASFARTEGATDVMEDRSITAEVLQEISQQVALRVTPQTLLSAIATQIQGAFETIHHVQVFVLSEDGTQAELAASTGQIGRILVDQNYTVPLGTSSIVSRVIESGLSMAEGPEGDSGRNERLQATDWQVVFPLRIGLKVLGALDVQSLDRRTFSDAATTATFQTLADSLALAIDNVSQYQRAEARLRENERLVNEARAALQEVQRLNDRLTGSAWTAYLKDSGASLKALVDLESKGIETDFVDTPTLKEAMQINQLVEDKHDGAQVIALPLRVRGRVIGAMEFELDETRHFTPEDLQLMQEVSERFGLAAENARLVDESQRSAQREALVNRMTSRFQATNDVETMLKEAVKSLSDVLEAERVAIRLGPPPDER